MQYEKRELLYENPLAGPEDVDEFVMEGDGAVSFPQDRMRMEHLRGPEDGQEANIVHWCPVDFPDDIAISWDFWPVREPGLCVFFFAATGRDGEDIFDDALEDREGVYRRYHSGDIDAYHVSYFRRLRQTREFHTCNLRKSHGFHLVDQGADPLPGVIDADPPYTIEVVKHGRQIVFTVDDLAVLEWTDDDPDTGPPHGGGKIGFRQQAPPICEYANLEVHAVEPVE